MAFLTCAVFVALPLFVFPFGQSMHIRRALAGCRVTAPRVVEFNPVTNDPFGFAVVTNLVEVNGLMFERAPKLFDEDVIQIPAPTTH